MKVKSDKLLKIAVGQNRTSLKWHNKEILWSEFLDKLANPVVTKETCAEYKAMKKSDRDNIKDVGGFVGGYLKDGRRKKENMKSRSLITLDLDCINTSVVDLWDTITLFYDCELCIYSTHSHTEKKPRLRLIMPTDKNIDAEEYEAISRRIADDIGIDMFDDTTYEPERLMYWSSASSDAVFIFKHQSGNLLDTEKVKKTYIDWKDTSTYPHSSRQSDIINKLIKKQEDPLTKQGLIGAFCRTYSIQEAIKVFLSEFYESSEKTNRYSYTKGSTTKGLVIYDDKFAYSHHGTDPTSGMLCNAFDLVRIHLFNSLDDDVKEGTVNIKLPSYIRMMELINNDEKVKLQLFEDSQKEIDEDFEYEDNKDWALQLEYNKKGVLENTIQNALLILENDPKIKGKLIYDEFANRAIVDEGVPWTSLKSHDWTDMDDSGVRNYLEKHYHITASYKIEDAKNLVFDKNKIHPVRDYIKNLTWDGIERVETIFIDYLGAEDNIYTREVARVHLTAAVARIFNPGVKYDTMPTLSGKQGIGKSTFIYKISKGWFSDSLDTMKGKEAAELIQGIWHIELGELNVTRKSDRDMVKAFLSRQHDIYRVAYAKNTSRFPRQCVFWGTTNDSQFLRDPTGDRRTYPIDCHITTPKKDIWTDLTEYEIDQIWAECYVRFKNNEPLRLCAEADEIAEIKQTEHKEDNPLRGLIIQYLERLYPEDWEDMNIRERHYYVNTDELESDFDNIKLTYKKDKVCVLEVWCELLGKKPADLKPINSREINDILRSLPGWSVHKSGLRFGKNYGHQRGYVRKKR